MFVVRKLLEEANDNYFKRLNDNEISKNDIEIYETIFPIRKLDARKLDDFVSKTNIDNLLIKISKLDNSYIKTLLNDVILILSNEKPNSSLAENLNLVKMRIEIDLDDDVKNFIYAEDIIEVLKTLPKRTFIVGGFVRDSIANRSANDMDFCTENSYEDVKKVFEKNKNFSIKETGKHFSVLIVTDKNNLESFEIAQLRKDKDNGGAEIGTIIDDAERRDFMNSAIYFDINSKVLIDPHGQSIDDSVRNVIRFIGKPEDRIKEDPLRVLRFYRFMGRGWVADSKSLKAVRTNFSLMMNETSHNRVMSEIEKMVMGA